MNMLGYLVTLSNLHSFTSNGQRTDLTMRMGPLHTLADEILSLPQYPIEAFRNNGYYRVGNMGKYLSKNLQEYLLDKVGNPNDEGIILTLYFSDNDDPKEANAHVRHYRDNDNNVPKDVYSVVSPYVHPSLIWPLA